MESRWNSSGWFSQDSLRCRFSTKSKKYGNLGMWTRKIPGKDFLHVDVQRHHMGRSAKRTSMSHQFHPWGWMCREVLFKSLVIPRTRIRNEIQAWRRMGWVGVTGSESGHPIFRATSALERGTLKSNGGGKLSIHFCGDYDNVELLFRTIVSANQLSIYGAVADRCEEFIPSFANTRRPIAMEKSESFADLLKTQRPLLTNEQAHWDMLQNHKERVENLPNDEQLIKLCTDEGFIKTVAPGQYFMTKDAEEFSQFDGHVACRKVHTLPRDGDSSTPKGWIRGNTKIRKAWIWDRNWIFI